MKKIWILLISCCTMLACKKVDVQFSYTPQAPRAGEVVTFSNLSSAGEDWAWSFGDGITSTLKSPTHTYKKPGIYRVMLKVDNKNSLTSAKEITVYDTVPTFVASDTVFYIFKDYTFTANLYNPYNLDVEYEWSLDDDEEDYVVITDTTMNNNSLHLYFTRPMNPASLSLRIVMNGDTIDIDKSYTVQDRVTYSILMRTQETDYQQRIFEDRAEELKPLASRDGFLDMEQDTMQSYNGKTFVLSELNDIFPGIQGFHIANRKIYYRLPTGLWVALLDGSDKVQIDDAYCPAMTLDKETTRIYWANDNGVWYMPFVGSDNNKFTTLPTQLNELQGVQKIAREQLDFIYY